MDADKFEKYMTGRDLEVLANCVTRNSRTMKVSGQKEKEKSLSNSYYILQGMKEGQLHFKTSPNENTKYWPSWSLPTVLESPSAHPCRRLLELSSCSIARLQTEHQSFFHVIQVDELQIPHNSGRANAHGLKWLALELQGGGIWGLLLKATNKAWTKHLYTIQVIFLTIFKTKMSHIRRAKHHCHITKLFQEVDNADLLLFFLHKKQGILKSHCFHHEDKNQYISTVSKNDKKKI